MCCYVHNSLQDTVKVKGEEITQRKINWDGEKKKRKKGKCFIYIYKTDNYTTALLVHPKERLCFQCLMSFLCLFHVSPF